MNEFLRNHPDVILVGLAIVFIAVLGAYYFWGIGVIDSSVNQAASASLKPSSPAAFNLQEAAGLDLKGALAQ